MSNMIVYITGASGLVGRHIISDLISNTTFDVVAISSCPDVVAKRHSMKERLTSIGYDVFLKKSPEQVENTSKILIHCAYTRKNDPQESKRSIDLAKSILVKCVDLSMDGVLNISSRSLYKEPEEGQLNTEESELNLSGLITLGKYAVELMAEAIFGRSNIAYSNLRLASVNELKMDNNMVRPLNVFVENVIAGKPIRVVGGMQVMSFIDPRDVASAIRSLLMINTNQWKDKYNIGTGWMCTDTLLNMAKLVVERGAQFDLNPVDINVEEKEVNQRAGLDISRITTDTGWKPQVSLSDMIDALYKMKMKK